ncbi:hypothetical protein SCOCK_30231 [Actinacidiphila cocklensis]|uniref:Uncharacterized protein n=1 Tax=Actinacidiphila cocklensis TaxID=887465 RepID=A0A9W4DS47_9ACTN|nr:hypothetical protein SCOCK_30231 [Actinacidiphila cocklensis]
MPRRPPLIPSRDFGTLPDMVIALGDGAPTPHGHLPAGPAASSPPTRRRSAAAQPARPADGPVPRLPRQLPNGNGNGTACPL